MSLADIIKTKKVLKGPKPTLLGKKKKTTNDASGKHVNGAVTKSLKKTKRLGTTHPVGKGAVVVDARNKIIQKNRSKITDARDKLAQIAKQSGDVRLKLMRKMELSRKAPSSARRLSPDAGFALSGRLTTKKRLAPSYMDEHLVAPPPPPGRYASRRAGAAVQRMDYDMELDDDIDFLPATVALRRTVQNDMAFAKMPPLPTFQRSVAMPDYRMHQQNPPAYAHHHHQQRVIRNASPPPPVASWHDADPFDCYEVPMGRPADVSEPKNLQRQIRNTSAAADLMPKGILRYSRDGRNNSPPPLPASMYRSATYTSSSTATAHQPQRHHRYVADLEDAAHNHLSYEMRHRLERAPDTNTSMGIFSNPYTVVNKPAQMPSSASSAASAGYRIVVSNLHSTVSQGDISELFEDIGELVEARLVRPGVAEVIFRTMKDAEQAVDTYHNRQLDGQPMKCLLVNPRASSKPTAPAIKNARR